MGARFISTGSLEGDLFSLYDVLSYLETSEVHPLPDQAVLEAELERLVMSGLLRQAGRRKYLVP